MVGELETLLCLSLVGGDKEPLMDAYKSADMTSV